MLQEAKKWHPIDLHLDAQEAKEVYNALVYYYAHKANARSTTYNVAQRMLNYKYDEEL